MSILSETTGTSAPETFNTGDSLSDVKEKFDIQPKTAIRLRKTFFGGYVPKGVDEYISSITADAQQVKQQLEKQIEGLLAEKRTVSQECSVLREQIKQAEENIRRSSEQIASMFSEEQMTEAKRRILSLEGDLKQAGEELAGLEHERQELGSLKLAYTAKASAVEQLEKDVTESRIELERRIRQNKMLEAALQESRDSSGEEIRKLSADNRILSDNCRELQKQIEACRARLSAAEEEKEKTESTLRRLEQERHTLEKQTAELESREERIRTAEADLTEREASVRNQLAEIEQKREALRSDSNQTNADRNTILDLRSRLDLSLAQTADAQKQRDLMDQQLKKVQAELNAAALKLSEEMSSGQQNGEMIRFLREQHAQEAAKICELEKDVKNKEAVIEQLKNDAEKAALFESERELTQRSVISLREALSQIMGFMERQAEEMEMLVERMKEDRAALEKALSDQAALRVENAGLLETQHAFQQRIAALKAEKKQLIKELEAKPAHTSRNEGADESDLKRPAAKEEKEAFETSGTTAEQPMLSAIVRVKKVLQKVKKEFSDLRG